MLYLYSINLSFQKYEKKLAFENMVGKGDKRANMALDRSPEYLRLSIFFSLSEKNLQEFVYVCTVQVAPIH